MKTIFLILILFVSSITFSQNLIRNPDFSNIEIEFRNGKKVFPNYWKAYDMLNFYTIFSHPAKYSEINTFGKPNDFSNLNGFFLLDILHHSTGIYTELESTLEKGISYNIEVELKIDRVNLNSDFRTTINDTTKGEIKDSADLDYNYIISLVTYFHLENPNGGCNSNKEYVIFDFPESITPDSTENWITLSKNYIAKGNERYYSIGTYNSKDYINILLTQNNDTTNYKHKWARYLIRKVSVTPQIKEQELIVSNTFEPDFLDQMKANATLILHSISFDLDSYDLNAYSLKEIAKIAVYMKSNREVHLNIVGHTDSTGAHEYNQILSEKRALSVYNVLIENGIPPESLDYEGKGKTPPLDDALYKENFKRNRRVEFEFITKD